MTKICSSPWTTVSIDGSGSVYSCLCPLWSKNTIVGNLHNQTLQEMFQTSITLDVLKQGVLDGSYSSCDSSVCPVPLSKENHSYMVDRDQLIENQLPTSIMLSVDYNCNLKCQSCRLERVFSKTIDPQVSFVLESIKKSYQDCKIPCQIMCDGSGDVFASLAYDKFLFEGEFPECFRLAITTNGNLIRKKLKKIEKIKKQIQSFIVSLDAATQQTYKKVRGGDFDIVLDGIRKLLDMNIQVYLQFVLQRENYHELIGYKQLANTLNVPYGVQLIVRWGHMSQEQWDYCKIENNPNVDLEQIKKDLTILQQDKLCNMNGGILTLLKN